MFRVTRFLVLSFLLTSCATVGSKPTEEPPGGETEDYGTPFDHLEQETENEGDVDGEKPPELVVVLGPGLAKGFAHAGALKAIREANLPIGLVIGNEMGALMGSLFATSRTNNDFDWKLTKLKTDHFKSGGMSLSQFFGNRKSASKLERYLNQTFSDQRIENTSPPLRIWNLPKGLGGEDPKLIESGLLKNLARDSLSHEGLFEIKERDFEQDYQSAIWAWPYPVQIAKELKLGPVVVIDVLSDIEEQKEGNQEDLKKRIFDVRQASNSEIELADILIVPDLKQVDVFDYNKKNQAIYAGEQAAKKKISDIRLLLEDDRDDGTE